MTREAIQEQVDQMPTSELLREDKRLTELCNPTPEDELRWEVYRDELHDRRFPNDTFIPHSWEATIQTLHESDLV